MLRVCRVVCPCCLLVLLCSQAGWGVTCSHPPLPNPHICSSAKTNLLPHLTALKDRLIHPLHTSQFTVTFGSLRQFSWFPAPPHLLLFIITAWSAKPQLAPLMSKRDRQKKLTYFNQLWTHWEDVVASWMVLSKGCYMGLKVLPARSALRQK